MVNFNYDDKVYIQSLKIFFVLKILKKVYKFFTGKMNNFLNFFCVETFSSFFAYFDKLYFTTSFIFILTFSSEKSDTGTKFINRGFKVGFIKRF